MKTKYLGEAALMIACILWGIGAVALAAANRSLGPLSIQSIRCLLGGLFLLLTIRVLDRTGYSRKPVTKQERRFLLISGVSCGILYFVYCFLQQFALIYTAAGKVSFLVCFDVALVPVIGTLLGRRISWRVWFCVLIALIGMCIMSVTSDLHIGKGELFAIACSVVSALHIILIGFVSPKVDSVRLSCIQFWVSFVCCGIFAIFRETIRIENLMQVWLPLLYAGVFSSGIGFTLQVVGQSRTDASKAAVIMCLSAVFSTFFGWLLLRQMLSLRELAGCAIVMIGVILVQINDYRDRQPEKQ